MTQKPLPTRTTFREQIWYILITLRETVRILTSGRRDAKIGAETDNPFKS
jgi:hypothetical protein